MTESKSNIGSPPSILVTAIEKLLTPLVKLMLSYQITYPQLSTMLKSIYVDVAENEFQVNGKRQSDSRINLLTGVHRKDVKRLRAQSKPSRSVPENISTGAKIIAHWLGTETYLDEQGKPLALKLKPGNGDSSPSFDALVTNVCRQDIRPRVILDEWLRLGIATVTDDRVSLNTGAFTPQKGFDEKAFFFGKNTQDHISASTSNLLGHKPSYFDRSVYYDQLSAASIDELSKLAEHLGMQALTQMNKAALLKQQADSDTLSQLDSYRMNFGIFNFNTQETTQKSPKS
ncbi:MAG: hypothetical protein COC19_08475 [SAR86 cluster bacterium]|uniref:Uncharacterized protein n=1 Tax=SAR86 cluster bacterium TaxID=2030880 RepID=A0A2A4MEV3_9GAMM|nr:MAG: hypothetical protein COC19_08475 [SAR86 cluster bacterium]